MGTNNLATKAPGDRNSEDDVNQYKSALVDDNLPRSSAGAPTTLNGSLGTTSLRWIKACVTKGYWSAGDIKSHYSYDGLVPIDQGWYPCDGTIINETNYEIIHGVGSWDIYVTSTVFDGKYSLNLVDKYLTGATATPQTGASAITSIGVTGSEVNLSHNHVVDEHNHQWHSISGSGTNSIGRDTTVGNDETFDSAGNYIDFPGSGITIGANLYTNDNNAIAVNNLTGDRSIRPESIEATYYMRII